MNKSLVVRQKMIKNKNKSKNKNKNKSNKQLVVTKNVPIVKSKKISMPTPKVGYSKDGDMMLQHIELVTTITTSNSSSSNNGFNLLGFHINAGLKATFPYLNAFAQNYTSYQFNVLSAMFVPRGNVTRDGAIMMYAEYDPGSEAPENRIEFLNRKNAVESQVFESLKFDCNKEDLAKEKSHYVRIGKIPDNSDIKLYDAAIIYVAYEGTPKNTLIGDIFLKYEIKLLTPKLRYAEKQISNIENTRIVSSSATNTNPIGNLATIVGDFAGSLLNAATGGASGMLFSTGKSILKMITCILSPSTAGAVCDDVNVGVRVLKNNVKEDDGIGIISLNEDDTDILAKFINDSTQFDDLTSTNAATLVNTVITGNSRFKQFVVAVPANGIVQLNYASYPVTLVPLGNQTLHFSDYDAVKAGILNRDTIVGISYYTG